MGKQAFKYIGLCMGLYLLIAAIEIFLLRPLINFIGIGFYTHLIVYNILLIIINPILCKLIIQKYFKFEAQNLAPEEIQADKN